MISIHDAAVRIGTTDHGPMNSLQRAIVALFVTAGVLLA
jgi:hypothetical protein